MLGKNNQPNLLISVDGKFSGIGEPTKERFDFWVVNGAWDGIYTDGFITVLGCPTGNFSSLEKMEILTDNQDRLRGEYQEVFNNWDNPNYVAPKQEKIFDSFFDDDIPF